VCPASVAAWAPRDLQALKTALSIAEVAFAYPREWCASIHRAAKKGSSRKSAFSFADLYALRAGLRADLLPDRRSGRGTQELLGHADISLTLNVYT